MLTEIRRVHDDLLIALVQLGRLAARAEPDVERMAELRPQLRRMRSVQKRVMDAIYPWLLEGLDRPVATEVRKLRARHLAMMKDAAAIADRWPIERQAEDWQAFRRESLALRLEMQGLLVEEQRLLYPLIQAALDAGRAAPLIR